MENLSNTENWLLKKQSLLTNSTTDSIPLTNFLSHNLENPTFVLSSYPRSGNTLLRTLLEKTTGIYTGSDCDKKRNLNR